MQVQELSCLQDALCNSAAGGICTPTRAHMELTGSTDARSILHGSQ